MSDVSIRMNKAYLELLQKRIGSTSVGASTARGMGPPGTIQAARRFLQGLDLNKHGQQSKIGWIKRLLGMRRKSCAPEI